jgi:hypothetical protein
VRTKKKSHPSEANPWSVQVVHLHRNTERARDLRHGDVSCGAARIGLVEERARIQPLLPHLSAACLGAPVSLPPRAPYQYSVLG